MSGSPERTGAARTRLARSVPGRRAPAGTTAAGSRRVRRSARGRHGSAGEIAGGGEDGHSRRRVAGTERPGRSTRRLPRTPRRAAGGATERPSAGRGGRSSIGSCQRKYEPRRPLTPGYPQGSSGGAGRSGWLPDCRTTRSRPTSEPGARVRSSTTRTTKSRRVGGRGRAGRRRRTRRGDSLLAGTVLVAGGAAVGAVEAGALEDHADRVEDLAQRPVTGRADRQGVVGEALTNLERVPALGALVLVRRHVIPFRPSGTPTTRLLIMRQRAEVFQLGRGIPSTQRGCPPDAEQRKVVRYPIWGGPAFSTVGPCVACFESSSVSGIVLATLLLVVAGTGIFVVRHCFPTYDGTVELAGLDADVEVVRDANGIPQIYADKPGDLFAAQGYVHAQDRFFEMDFRRHVTSGRLAGAVRQGRAGDGQVRPHARLAPGRRGGAGPAQPDHPAVPGRLRPRRQRVPGHPLGLRPQPRVRRTVAEGHRLPPGAVDRGRLAGLAEGDGVGPRRQHGRGDRPDQAGGDHPARNIRRALPGVPVRPERADPRQRGRRTRTAPFSPTAPVEPEAGRGMLTKDLLKSLDSVDKVTKGLPQLLGRGDGIGSNSWVVSGEHTTTGKPLLANDPHLGATMPGIWTQVGLHCNNVRPGLPVRRVRLQLLRSAGRRDRPQQRDRLGLHQPQPRRDRPLPGEAERQRRALRRQGRAADDPDRDVQGRRPGRARRRSPSGRPGTVRSSPTSATTQREAGELAAKGKSPSRTASRCAGPR